MISILELKRQLQKLGCSLVTQEEGKLLWFAYPGALARCDQLKE